VSVSAEFVQQILLEMTRMKNEMEKLETGIRRYTGDDLSSLTLDDVSDLEQQLEYSVSKVRARKVHCLLYIIVLVQLLQLLPVLCCIIRSLLEQQWHLMSSGSCTTLAASAPEPTA
jgi:hypothetical protein